jgi:hypothetical protein
MWEDQALALLFNRQVGNCSSGEFPVPDSALKRLPGLRFEPDFAGSFIESDLQDLKTITRNACAFIRFHAPRQRSLARLQRQPDRVLQSFDRTFDSKLGVTTFAFFPQDVAAQSGSVLVEDPERLNRSPGLLDRPDVPRFDAS